jgi:hypothetical protein
LAFAASTSRSRAGADVTSASISRSRGSGHPVQDALIEHLVVRHRRMREAGDFLHELQR